MTEVNDAANDARHAQLRSLIQREWETAMDRLFYAVDRYATANEYTEDDVALALSCQIDDDTADAYEEWIDS